MRKRKKRKRETWREKKKNVQKGSKKREKNKSFLKKFVSFVLISFIVFKKSQQKIDSLRFFFLICSLFWCRLFFFYSVCCCSPHVSLLPLVFLLFVFILFFRNLFVNLFEYDDLTMHGNHNPHNARAGALLIHRPAWVDQHTGGSRLTPKVHRCPKGMAVGGSSAQHGTAVHCRNTANMVASDETFPRDDHHVHFNSDG